MTLNDSLRIADSKIGDETILWNLKTGAYFGLDAVGSRFPELLERDCLRDGKLHEFCFRFVSWRNHYPNSPPLAAIQHSSQTPD